MNRRAFLKALTTAVAGAASAIHMPGWVPLPPVQPPIGPQVLTFKGAPMVFDKYASTNAIYFVNHRSIAWTFRDGDA